MKEGVEVKVLEDIHVAIIRVGEIQRGVIKLVRVSTDNSGGRGFELTPVASLINPPVRGSG